MDILGNIENLQDCIRPIRLLMADPKFYEVAYAINVHMLDENGELKEIDPALALRQWMGLKRSFESKGIQVDIVGSKKGLPDLVFTANQSFPLPDGRVVLSKMKSLEREPEVELLKDWYIENGIKEFIPMKNIFESMGDVVWHPGKKLLWAGHGFRTTNEALVELHKKIEIPIIPLKLQMEEFYHLDTCFSILDENTLAFFPEAFDRETIDFLENWFDRIIKIDKEEALNNFAGNCYCMDKKNVFLQKGSLKFEKELRKLGFNPIAVDTSEFIKGGGSVFCMKLPLFF